MAKMNNSETGVGSSSSDHPCPVALVTASNKRKDTLCVPQDLCATESINDGTQGDTNKKECCMDLERKKKRRVRHPTSPSQKQFMTLKLAHDSLMRGRQYVSLPLMRANGMTKLGLLTLVGKDLVKCQVNLRGEKSGKQLCLGEGWREFAMANGLKTGEYFTLEFVWENGTPMLRLVNTVSTTDRKQIGESSKAMEKECFSTEPCNINQTNNEKNNIDERSTSTSSLVQNREVTLALVPEDVKDCALHLPSQFVKAMGIQKRGKITLIGKDEMKWWGYLLSRDGTVAVGIGWRNFCEANGVKPGESFTLKFIKEEEDNSSVFQFCPNSVD